MNSAYIRFYTSMDGLSLEFRNSDCYDCLFDRIMTLYPGQNTTYREFDMQHELDFRVSKDGASSEYSRLSFQEYGCYTVHIPSFNETMSIWVDKPGHDYDTAAYYMLGGSLLLLVLYIIGENLYKKYYKNKYQPLQTEETKKADDKASKRVLTIDVYRGIWLLFMIYSNFGGGWYYWWRHVAYNGTFMFCMGCSLRLSINNNLKQLYAQGYSSLKVFTKISFKVLRRCIVFVLFCWLQNGNTNFKDARLFGVMVYFAISYFINSYIFIFRYMVNKHFPNTQKYDLLFELVPILICFFTNWGLSEFLPLPEGCPRGYRGPGGKGDQGKYPHCTGGANRIIDISTSILFITIHYYNHVYTGTSCKPLYNCLSTDSEGVLGSLNAACITYLGSIVTYVSNYYKSLSDNKIRHLSLISWCSILGFCCLLFAGILCGFKRDGGYMPINKTLWSTSFILYVAGLDFIMFIFVYLLVDVNKVWSGYPFQAAGMNPLIVYMIHEMCMHIMPFGYDFETKDHLHYMISQWVMGCGAWLCIANYLRRTKTFIKI
ncbi:hypothetical protein WA158_002693 [Blastocystis sp. Blastoise]